LEWLSSLLFNYCLDVYYAGVELGTKVEAMEKLLEELYTQMKYASDRRPKRAR